MAMDLHRTAPPTHLQGARNDETVNKTDGILDDHVREGRQNGSRQLASITRGAESHLPHKARMGYGRIRRGEDGHCRLMRFTRLAVLNTISVLKPRACAI